MEALPFQSTILSAVLQSQYWVLQIQPGILWMPDILAKNANIKFRMTGANFATIWFQVKTCLFGQAF